MTFVITFTIIGLLTVSIINYKSIDGKLTIRKLSLLLCVSAKAQSALIFPNFKVVNKSCSHFINISETLKISTFVVVDESICYKQNVCCGIVWNICDHFKIGKDVCIVNVCQKLIAQIYIQIIVILMIIEV